MCSFSHLLCYFIIYQPQKRRRMACLSLSSPAGDSRARLFRRWWLNTRLQVRSSTSCPSAPSSFLWRLSTTQDMAPSSTTHLYCLATGEPLLSTGKWCSWDQVEEKQDTVTAVLFHFLYRSSQDTDPRWQKGRVYSVLGWWRTGYWSHPAAERVWCWTQWHCQHHLQEISLPRGSKRHSK